MKPIAPYQIKKIYAIGNALGIVERDNDQDNLHLLVEAMTGKESVKALAYSEANGVIAELQRRQGGYVPPQSKRKTVHPEVAGGATEGQQRKAWQLMYELQKLDVVPSSASLGERLSGIIKKELRVDATPQRPFSWLDFKTTNKLIEILKKYISSAKRRSGGDNNACN